MRGQVWRGRSKVPQGSRLLQVAVDGSGALLGSLRGAEKAQGETQTQGRTFRSPGGSGCAQGPGSCRRSENWRDTFFGDFKKIGEPRAKKEAPAAFAHSREWAYETRAKGCSWSASSSVCNFFLGRGMGPLAGGGEQVRGRSGGGWGLGWPSGGGARRPAAGGGGPQPWSREGP